MKNINSLQKTIVNAVWKLKERINHQALLLSMIQCPNRVFRDPQRAIDKQAYEEKAVAHELRKSHSLLRFK
jgi:hypothetical protein